MHTIMRMGVRRRKPWRNSVSRLNKIYFGTTVFSIPTAANHLDIQPSALGLDGVPSMGDVFLACNGDQMAVPCVLGAPYLRQTTGFNAWILNFYDPSTNEPYFAKPTRIRVNWLYIRAS